eukprot:140447-Prorocentrum_minimum.AAC.1
MRALTRTPQGPWDSPEGGGIPYLGQTITGFEKILTLGHSGGAHTLGHSGAYQRRDQRQLGEEVAPPARRRQRGRHTFGHSGGTAEPEERLRGVAGGRHREGVQGVRALPARAGQQPPRAGQAVLSLVNGQQSMVNGQKPPRAGQAVLSLLRHNRKKDA